MAAQPTVRIRTQKRCFPVAKELYGLFYEDINRSGDGGIYPEMLRNRAFEDSLIPGGCTVDATRSVFVNRGGWPGAFGGGEGMEEWSRDLPPTSIPGWYAQHAEMHLDQTDTMNDK